MALISPQVCPWPQKSKLIVLIAASSKAGLKGFSQLQDSPDHEEAKGDTLRTVLEKGDGVLAVLVGEDGGVVEDGGQEVDSGDGDEEEEGGLHQGALADGLAQEEGSAHRQ